MVLQLWDRFVRPKVDLVAFQEIIHCPSGFSMSDPMGLEALAHDWPVKPLYDFPTFPLITATLDRVIFIGNQLLLIAP